MANRNYLLSRLVGNFQVDRVTDEVTIRDAVVVDSDIEIQSGGRLVFSDSESSLNLGGRILRTNSNFDSDLISIIINSLDTINDSDYDPGSIDYPSLINQLGNKFALNNLFNVDFPNDPTVGQTLTFNGISWEPSTPEPSASFINFVLTRASGEAQIDGQTVFRLSPNDDIKRPLVFLNGHILGRDSESSDSDGAIDYKIRRNTAGNGGSILFNSPLEQGDEVVIADWNQLTDASFFKFYYRHNDSDSDAVDVLHRLSDSDGIVSPGDPGYDSEVSPFVSIRNRSGDALVFLNGMLMAEQGKTNPAYQSGILSPITVNGDSDYYWGTGNDSEERVLYFTTPIRTNDEVVVVWAQDEFLQTEETYEIITHSVMVDSDGIGHTNSVTEYTIPSNDNTNSNRNLVVSDYDSTLVFLNGHLLRRHPDDYTNEDSKFNFTFPLRFGDRLQFVLLRGLVQRTSFGGLSNVSNQVDNNNDDVGDGSTLVYVDSTNRWVGHYSDQVNSSPVPLAWGRWDFDSEGVSSGTPTDLYTKTVNNLVGHGVILDSDTDGGTDGVYYFTLDSDVIGPLANYNPDDLAVVASICNGVAAPQMSCSNIMNDLRIRVRTYTGVDHGGISVGDPVNTGRIHFTVFGNK